MNLKHRVKVYLTASGGWCARCSNKSCGRGGVLYIGIGPWAKLDAPAAKALHLKQVKEGKK